MSFSRVSHIKQNLKLLILVSYLQVLPDLEVATYMFALYLYFHFLPLIVYIIFDIVLLIGEYLVWFF